MKNPIVEVREERQLSPTELAIMAGVDAVMVRRLERGEAAKLSGKVLDALADLGYDKGEMARSYKQWRQEKAVIVRNGLIA